MIKSNFHTHTTFCDGINTVQELIDAAIAKGFRRLGFSGHGNVPHAGLYPGMTLEATCGYRKEINGLKSKYAGVLDIFTGLENDSACMHPAADYDYTIGSLHCIKCGDWYYSVDSRESIVARVVSDEFGGDGLAFALAYFDAVHEFASEKRADILGHIDLVRRFNTGLDLDKNSDKNSATAQTYRFFDETDARYRRAAEAALERAVRSGYIIEVSTAPLARGISGETYPARFLLECAIGLNARVIVNSDAHMADHLDYAFDETESVLCDFGFKERWEYSQDGFVPINLPV